jgi:hypothetical protein
MFSHRPIQCPMLVLCTALPVAMAIAGCGASPPTQAGIDAPPTQADIETDLRDYSAIAPIVDAWVAEQNLPTPIAFSTERPKPDEAVTTVEYGPEPKQKKMLTLKKRDGKWEVQQP